MLKENDQFEFAPFILSEQEIIAFAQEYDPLDVHIDIEKAQKSFFKDLIASGSHIFNYIYKRDWLPLFKESIICGVEINNWKFLKPVYANKKIFATVTVLKVVFNIEKNYNTVDWLFEFRNEQEELLQRLEMIILHKADKL